jgi:hypothetical protein
MARQPDLAALCNLIEQAYLAVGSDPIPAGAVASVRENLEAALALAKMLEDQNRASIRE